MEWASILLAVGGAIWVPFRRRGRRCWLRLRSCSPVGEGVFPSWRLSCYSARRVRHPICQRLRNASTVVNGGCGHRSLPFHFLGAARLNRRSRISGSASERRENDHIQLKVKELNLSRRFRVLPGSRAGPRGFRFDREHRAACFANHTFGYASKDKSDRPIERERGRRKPDLESIPPAGSRRPPEAARSLHPKAAVRPALPAQ